MGSLFQPFLALVAVLAFGWWVFDQARDAASESEEKRRQILVSGIKGTIIGIVVLGLGFWAYSVMNKESPAPIIPLALGVIIGFPLTVLSIARFIGAKVSRSSPSAEL